MAKPAKTTEQTPDSTLSSLYSRKEEVLAARMGTVQATQKPELIGAELEMLIRDEFASLLPNSLKIFAGFVIEPDGKTSSHFDAIIVDARYPILAVVAGSALVPLHAVIGIIEIKTTLGTKSIREIVDKRNELAYLSEVLDADLQQQAKESAETELSHRIKTNQSADRIKALEAQLKAERFGAPTLSEARFWALGYRAEVTDHTVAKAHWQPLFYDIHLLKSKPGTPRTNKIPIASFGPDGPSRHFWKELDMDPVSVRRTKFGYGYFLQSVMTDAVEVLSGRGQDLSAIGKHFGQYANLLVDIETA